jgi:hypothetical protein
MTPPTRRFTLRDAMILVAATAVGITWTRATVAAIRDRMPPAMLGPQTGLSYLVWWPPAAAPALMSASLAIAAILLRRPRGGGRRFPARPGAVACGVAVAALVIQALLVAAGMGLARVPGMTGGLATGDSPSWSAIARGLSDVGLAVIGAWLARASGPPPEGGSHWAEAAGRLLGAGWVALFVIVKLVPYIMGA